MLCTRVSLVPPLRPQPIMNLPAMEERGGGPELRPTFFPDSIDRIPLCAADRSVPAVESVAGDERAALELDRLARLLEAQAPAEELLEAATTSTQRYRVEGECRPPPTYTHVQTAGLAAASPASSFIGLTPSS